MAVQSQDSPTMLKALTNPVTHKSAIAKLATNKFPMVLSFCKAKVILCGTDVQDLSFSNFTNKTKHGPFLTLLITKAPRTNAFPKVPTNVRNEMKIRYGTAMSFFLPMKLNLQLSFPWHVMFSSRSSQTLRMSNSMTDEYNQKTKQI